MHKSSSCCVWAMPHHHCLLRIQKLCIFIIIKNNALCIIYEISFYCNNLQHLLVNKTLLFHINVAYIYILHYTILGRLYSTPKYKNTWMHKFYDTAKNYLYIYLRKTESGTKYKLLIWLFFKYLTRKWLKSVLSFNK